MAGQGVGRQPSARWPAGLVPHHHGRASPWQARQGQEKPAPDSYLRRDLLGASMKQMGPQDARPQRGQQTAQGRCRLPAECRQRGQAGRLRRRRTGDLSGSELLLPGQAVEKDSALSEATLEGCRPTRWRTPESFCASFGSDARQRIYVAYAPSCWGAASHLRNTHERVSAATSPMAPFRHCHSTDRAPPYLLVPHRTDRGERRERTPPARKRMSRYERPYGLLRCPIRLRNLSTARSYAPLRSGFISSKVSWVGFTMAIQHIHP